MARHLAKAFSKIGHIVADTMLANWKHCFRCKYVCAFLIYSSEANLFP